MRSHVALRACLLALASVVVAWGVYAMTRYGWRDVYADQWRLYHRFLTLPFPDNVLFLENGHRPVVPNLLRVAEIAWLRGNQWLQWSAGLAFALLTVLIGGWIVLRDRATPPVNRAASALALSLAVFWLANSRMLMHPNESVHTYLITLLVVVASGVGSRLDAGARGGWETVALVGCGLVATFSFGPGIALFVAIAIALAVARARIVHVAFVLAGMVATLALYFALPGGQGVSGVLALQPVANARVAAQWLSAPILYALLPFLDGNLVSMLPWEWLRGVARSTSAGYTAAFGNVWESRGPQLVVGALGIAALVQQSIRCARHGTTATQFAGLVAAWFGLGVAGIVSISRLAYFDAFPGQLYASRYLPWPCLFWAGLALLALGRTVQPDAPVRRTTRPAIVTAIVLAAAAALASNPGWMGWARMTQALARHQASAVLADAYSSTLFQGETVPAEVAAGIPPMRAAGIAMFAHPVAGRLGVRLAEPMPALAAGDVIATFRPFVGDSGVAAVEVEATLPPGGSWPRADYWVLTDPAGIVVGYAHYEPLDARRTLRGIARREGRADELHAYPWTAEGKPGQGLRLALRLPDAR